MNRIHQLATFIEALDTVMPDLEERKFYQDMEKGKKTIKNLRELILDLGMELKALEKEEK